MGKYQAEQSRESTMVEAPPLIDSATSTKMLDSQRAIPEPVQEPILLSPPMVGAAEREAILRALDSGWIAPAGHELNQFEQEIAELVGAEAALATNTGTGALHLGLLVAGVKPGDEVVVQTATFAASAFAVCHAQATPVFCDTEPVTGMMDPDALQQFLVERAKINRLPAAVMPVDLYGNCADYSALRAVCDPYGVPIVQDAAEALGAVSQGQSAGTHGLVGVFSFNGNKIITTSGGGALVGPAGLIERAAKLACQAKEPVAHYEHLEIGYNYRMSNLLAALGRAQLTGLADRITSRGRIRALYQELLPEVTWMPQGVTESPNNWLTFGQLPVGIDPAIMVEKLNSQKIEVRRSWKPMHLQPVFAASEFVGGSHAEAVYASGVCLPSSQELTYSQVDRVASMVRSLLGPATS